MNTCNDSIFRSHCVKLGLGIYGFSLKTNAAIKEENILCHSIETAAAKDEIKKFLRKPNTVLICQAELYGGMESNSVLFCVADGDDDKNLRCHLMRATSALKIIYGFKKEHPNVIGFPCANISPRFMSCCKTVQMHTWDCITCGVYSVCRPCSIKCHRGHNIRAKKVKKFRSKKKGYCNCSKNSCCSLN